MHSTDPAESGQPLVSSADDSPRNVPDGIPLPSASPGYLEVARCHGPHAPHVEDRDSLGSIRIPPLRVGSSPLWSHQHKGCCARFPRGLHNPVTSERLKPKSPNARNSPRTTASAVSILRTISTPDPVLPPVVRDPDVGNVQGLPGSECRTSDQVNAVFYVHWRNAKSILRNR